MENQNLDSVMKRPQNPTNNLPTGDPMAAIRAATGLDMRAEDLKDREEVLAAQAETSNEHNPMVQETVPTRIIPPRPVGGIGVLTPEESAQLRAGGNFQKIDPNKEALRQQHEKTEKLKNEDRQSMDSMFDDAINAESARNEAWDKKFEQNPELKRELVQQDPENASANYVPAMSDTHVNETKRTAVRFDASNDDEDMMPAYDVEETPVEKLKREKAEADEEKRPDASAPDSDMAEYVSNLVTIDYDGNEEDRMVDIIRDKVPMVTETPRPYKKSNPMGDQAFLNAITKYKKDNFRKVTVTLINSGFMVDEVGTGPVDLIQLYTATDQNTTMLDYQLAKMTTVIKNVVGTHPMVNPNDLKRMIHFADYQMLAYGHVAATLKEVEMLHTCDKCGKDFHIKANSTDLIINADEMREKMQRIQAASTIEENSLMTKDITYTTESGFVVVIGHPSYQEYATYMRELKDMIANGDDVTNNRIQQMSEILPFIRKITMPNGVYTSNLFQRYSALTVLTEDEFDAISKEIGNLTKQIIIPKFGIKSVKCPHCGEVNTNIAYDDLDSLLFFHFTVTRLLKQTDR